MGLEQTKEQSSGRPGLVRSIWWARVSFALWVYKWSKTKFPNCTLFPCVREIAEYSDIFGSTPALSVPNSASRRDSGEARVAHRALLLPLVNKSKKGVRLYATTCDFTSSIRPV